MVHRIHEIILFVVNSEELCLKHGNSRQPAYEPGKLTVPVICRAKFAPGDSDTESIHSLSQDSDGIVPTIKHDTI